MIGIDVSEKYIGLEENTNRKQIMGLLNSKAVKGDISIDPSQTAWCAAWINFCERTVGNPGNGHLNARSFLTYGTAVQLEDAQRGDIVVFDFEHNGVNGHVTYFESYDPATHSVSVCGGNQSNHVSKITYGTSNIIGIRRP